MTIKEADPERLLELGDNFRNGGLRHAELGGRLGRAATLHDCEKDFEVAKGVADARDRGRLSHRQCL
jgi:hypothetical protein